MPTASTSSPRPSRAAATAPGVRDTLPQNRLSANSTATPAVRARYARLRRRVVVMTKLLLYDAL